MWFVVICLLAAVTSGRTENVLGRGNIDYENIFEDRMRKELESPKLLISPKEELPGTVDIAGIEDQDMITLRDLRLLQDPVLRITSLDSTLRLFSTRIGVDFDNMFFTGRIYTNDDTTPVGVVRFTLRNVKASGHVGFDLPGRGRLISTNYYIKYENDSPHHLEIESRDERLTELIHKFLDKRLKQGIRKVMDAMLKRRIDTALAKIPIADIYGTRDVKEMRDWTGNYNNNFMNKLLEDLNRRFFEHNKAQIPLPDLDLPLTISLIYDFDYGRVLARYGWLRNLGTFFRRESVSVSFVGEDLIIFGVVGLRELKFGYDNCDVSLLGTGIGLSGSITGTIGNNAAEITIRVNPVNQAMHLENFRISELSDSDVELSAGLGPIDWLASIIADLVTNGLMTDVVPMIEPVIRNEISEALRYMNPRVPM